MTITLNHLFNNHTPTEIVSCLNMLGIKPWSIKLNSKIIASVKNHVVLATMFDWIGEYPLILFEDCKAYVTLNALGKTFHAIQDDIKKTIKHRKYFTEFFATISSEDAQEVFIKYRHPMNRVLDMKYGFNVCLDMNFRLNTCDDPRLIAYFLVHYDTKKNDNFLLLPHWRVQRDIARDVYEYVKGGSDIVALQGFIIMNFEHFSVSEFHDIFSRTRTAQVLVHDAYVLNRAIWDTEYALNDKLVRYKDRTRYSMSYVPLNVILNYLDLFPEKRTSIYLEMGKYLQYESQKVVRRSLAKIDYRSLAVRRIYAHQHESVFILNKFGLIYGARKLDIDKTYDNSTMELFTEYILNIQTPDEISAKIVNEGVSSYDTNELHKMGIGLPAITFDDNIMYRGYKYTWLLANGAMFAPNVSDILIKKFSIRLGVYNFVGNTEYIKADVQKLHDKTIKLEMLKANETMQRGIFYEQDVVYLMRLTAYDIYERFSCTKGVETVKWLSEEIVRFNYMQYPSAFRRDDTYVEKIDPNLIARVKGACIFFERLRSAMNMSSDMLSDLIVECTN